MGRNSRRQQRMEREEELEEEETVTDSEPSPNYQNIFSSFIQPTAENDPSADEEDDDGDDLVNQQSTKKKKRKPKKKKKTISKTLQAADDEATNITPATTTTTTTTTSVDQTDSKKKPKPELDEIDRALVELAEKLPNSITIGKPMDSKTFIDRTNAIMDEILKVDTRNLDYEVELRRMFGSKVVASTSSNNNQIAQMYGSKISNNPHHLLNTKMKLKSTILTKPHPLWPQLNKSSLGLSVRKLTPEEIESRGLYKSDEWFKFEHSLLFRWYQSMFLKAVAESDPNLLIRILQKSPYHPYALLQLSEVVAQHNDHLQSINLVNQTLYVNEKVLNFRTSASSESSNHNSKSTTLGHIRLDYDSAENRNFFKALNAKLRFLIKQGYYKTALETCKLLFSLNPYHDPYGALFWIDFLAIKADQHEFFLHLMKALPGLQRRDPKSIFFSAYPGLHFAKAMCMRVMEEKNHESHEGSDSALESAVLRFPQVLEPLAERIGISLPAKFGEIKVLNLPFTLPENYPDTEVRVVDPHDLINLTSQIFVHRSSPLWKLPQFSSWLKSTVERCMDNFDNFKHVDTRFSFKIATQADPYYDTFESVYRSVMASDDEALKRLLPPWVYEISGFMTHTFDPIPPRGGGLYDGNYFKDIPKGRTYVVAITERDRVTDDDDEEVGGGGEAIRVNEQEAEEEENGIIFSDEFDATHLDGLVINRLIHRIQFQLEANYDQLSANQCQNLLNRLEVLINRRREIDEFNPPIPQPQPELEAPSDQEDAEEFEVDSQDSHVDRSHQMPGSFFYQPPS